MYDKSLRRQLGNFPQAYSHIGLIHSALNLSGYIADTPTRRSARQLSRLVAFRPAPYVAAAPIPPIGCKMPYHHRQPDIPEQQGE